MIQFETIAYIIGDARKKRSYEQRGYKNVIIDALNKELYPLFKEGVYIQWEDKDIVEVLAQEIPTFRITSINDYRAVRNEWTPVEENFGLSVSVRELLKLLSKVSLNCGVKIELVHKV